MSPFIFHHPAGDVAQWISDLVAGSLVIVLSLASYWRPTGWAHLLLVLVGAWLLGFGRFGQTPPLVPALQNDIVVGLLLFMFAVVPNEASLPPRAWRRFDT
jgi:hypothetical protein